MEKAADFELLENWRERVENLVASGDVDAAISLLETVVTRFETTPGEAIDFLLSSVLEELGKLYSSKNLFLKSDALRRRAAFLQRRCHGIPPPATEETERLASSCVQSACHSESSRDGLRTRSVGADSYKISNVVDDWEALADRSTDELMLLANLADLPKVPSNKINASAGGQRDEFNVDAVVDDWEDLADRSPSELMFPTNLAGFSKDTPEDSGVSICRRRGRGTFSYNKDELYNEKFYDLTLDSAGDDESDRTVEKNDTDEIKLAYRRNTQHILVLSDFPQSLTTMDLEKLFVDFKNRGLAIRWVNDTTALAVFPTPSAASEAKQHIVVPWNTRILDENDPLINSISGQDVEPPRVRPPTSAATAQRLIAHGIGLKLPTTSSGFRARKIQEETRRARIIERQKQRDDAWDD